MIYNFIILTAILIFPNIKSGDEIYACKEMTISFDKSKVRWGIKNNSQCLDSLLKVNASVKKLTILFSGQSYVFDKTSINDRFQGHILFKGNGKTTFHLGERFIRITARSMPLRLTNHINRFDTEIQVQAADKAISLVRILSPDTVETAWNSKTNDCLSVSTIVGNTIKFKDSINFNYTVDKAELLGYVDSGVRLEGIDFKTRGDIYSMLILTGTSVGIQNCTFSNEGPYNLHALVDMYACEDVKVDAVALNGKVDYGILINCSRCISCTNIQSNTCLQAIVPATWTTNVVVDGLYCNGSVIDAHPSFNITYKNVTIENGAFYWNCRALGVHLENCHFDVVDDFTDVSLYLGILALTREYEFLYDEYDVVCYGVNWVHTDFGFNGLHVHKCRRFIVDRCETQEVSVGSGVKEFVVTNSHVGRIASADCNYLVENTIFDASLQGNSKINPPLSCSNDGVLNVKGCLFKGYEGQYLFNYIHWPSTRIYLQDCTFPSMIGFVKSTYMDKDMYTNIFVSGNDSDGAVRMFKDVHLSVNRKD